MNAFSPSPKGACSVSSSSKETNTFSFPTAKGPIGPNEEDDNDDAKEEDDEGDEEEEFDDDDEALTVVAEDVETRFTGLLDGAMMMLTEFALMGGRLPRMKEVFFITI